MKKNCTNPCFSNGSSCVDWLEINCEKCTKSSHYNEKKDTYSKIRCSIQEDIFTQYLGNGNESIRQRSYDATRHLRCPYFNDTSKKKKLKKECKKNENQIELF